MRSVYETRLADFLPTPEDLNDFAAGSAVAEALGAFDRTITWLKLIYDLRRDEETSILLAAAHSKLIEIWILLPLGLAHSSYTALRTFVDVCTSYTFYCSNAAEWSAVCEDRANWESRADVVKWHIRFTPNFREVNKALGLSQKLENDYRELSSYVHGIPVGGLPKLRGIERVHLSDQDMNQFVRIAKATDYDINLLFLSVFHQDLALLSAEDYGTITSGIDLEKLGRAGIVIPRA